jgi:two-component system, LytTR family, sensor kinase
MNQIIQKRKLFIIVLAWLAVFAYICYDSYDCIKPLSPWIWMMNYHFIFNFSCFLFIFKYLKPKYYKESYKNKFYIYVIISFLSMICLRVLGVSLINYFAFDLPFRPYYAFFAYFIRYCITSVIYYSTVAGFYVILTRIYLDEKIKELELEKKNTEIAYLMSQINPHSIFNTLNGIYTLIDKGNSDARLSVSKFSSMLRYQLYDCLKDKVSMKDEIEYLQNFTYLYELRVEGVKSSLSYDENLLSKKISPLLFVPFVENAFKYACPDSQKSQIEIKLSSIENGIHFSCINSFNENKKNEYGGIGIKNVTRRLQLLYPNKHKLIINQTKPIFEVILEIEE